MAQASFQNTSVSHLAHRADPVCSVCGDRAMAMTLFTTDSPWRVCNDIGCRMVLDKHKSMSASDFGQYLAVQSKQIRLRRVASKEATRRLREKLAADAAEEAKWLRQLEAIEPVQSSACTMRLTIPSGPRHSSRLSESRRETHVNHLKSIIGEAAALPEGETSDIRLISTTGPDPIARELCTMCRGGCCTRGGDSAYLSAHTIRRVMSGQPEVSAETLLEQYESFLSEEVMTDSCIHHTPTGCALPRDFRSDICNSFACTSLAILSARPTETRSAEEVVLVLQRRSGLWAQEQIDSDNAVIGAALLTENGSLPLNLPHGAEFTAATIS